MSQETGSAMNEPERFARLRHDLANPLAAVLAEVQLLLMDSHALPEDIQTGLRAIEAAAVKMRAVLRGSGVEDPSP
jgi:signal transduction histidine kinase